MNPATRRIHYVEEQIVRELALRSRMKAVIEAGFARTADRADVVRVSVVQEAVGAALDLAVGPTFRTQVVEAARWAGWKIVVSRGHVRYFRGMRAR